MFGVTNVLAPPISFGNTCPPISNWTQALYKVPVDASGSRGLHLDVEIFLFKSVTRQVVNYLMNIIK